MAVTAGDLVDLNGIASFFVRATPATPATPATLATPATPATPTKHLRARTVPRRRIILSVRD